MNLLCRISGPTVDTGETKGSDKERCDVTETVEYGLRDAGCAGELIDRYRVLEKAGDTKACLDLLRRHRCELVIALHEAQKPIDVCDWIIRGLEREL